MSFDLILVGTDAAGDEEQVAVLIDQTLAKLGATGSLVEGLFELADGSPIEMSLASTSLHLSVRGDSQPVMAAIFALAEATRAFVVPVENPVAIRTPSNHRDAVESEVDELELLEAANAAELAGHLSGGFGDWSDYRDQIVAETPPPPPPPLATPPSATTRPVKKGWFASLFSKS